MNRPNCRLYDNGRCNHSSAYRAVLPNRLCIDAYPADPRAGACRVRIEFPRPPLNPPPRKP